MLELCTHAFDPGDDRSLHIENDRTVSMDDTMRRIVLNTSKR
ncbi:hypothetical protein [Sphingobacterium sp. E70]|nr:hypothetical protein [Sphingobacterium sp. E70]